MTTALVTGASRGIGKATAIRLSSLGYEVFLLGRDESALASVVDACAGAADWLAGDLRDPGFRSDAVREATARFGPVGVLVNNAGAARREPVYAADLDAWSDVLELNFTAAVHLCRCVLPSMIERKSGAIVNVSSISGRSTDAGSGIYAATKHALNGFGGCMFEDVREYGIKVSTIMPGFVATELTADLGLDADRMIRPDDVADAIQFVLSSSGDCCPTEIVIRPQFRP